MGVIRSTPATNKPLFFSIKDAEEEARQTVESARADATTIANAAHQQGTQAGFREGYDSGFTQGQLAGREQALAEYREQLAAAAEALSRAQADFAAAQDEFSSQVLRDCVELSLAVARRITRTQAQVDPQVLAVNLEAAVKLVVGSKCFRIAFHPHDRSAIDHALEQLKMSYPVLEGARLIEDATLSRGGCRIYTESGLVDADIESQLDRLIEQIHPSGNSKP